MRDCAQALWRSILVYVVISDLEPRKPHHAAQRFIAVWARVTLTGLAFCAQLFVFFLILTRGQELTSWLAPTSIAISILVVAYILNSRMLIEYKMMWTIIIMLMPLFGGVFYLLFGTRTGTRGQLERYRRLLAAAAQEQDDAPGLLLAHDPALLPGENGEPDDLSDPDASTSGMVETGQVGDQTLLPIRAGGPGERRRLPRRLRRGVFARWTAEARAARKRRDYVPSPVVTTDVVLPDAAPDAIRQASFLATVGPFYPYRDTATTYYPLGEDAFEAMLEALEGATRWIGVEYFIIAEGAMWTTMSEVLKRKAREGVEVRLMYDDMGSLWRLPAGFIADLTSAGVRVAPVNRFGANLSMRYNNRDHRKILVVDGIVGFTGGINIADEYINLRPRFGHWKDTTIRLHGPGAWGLSVLFFSLWDHIHKDVHTDLSAYRPRPSEVAALPAQPGVVVSYDDTPLDDYSLGWEAYRNMMTRAQHSIDLITPYLVPTAEMINTLSSMALSGVRVRIITPGIPDKAYVYALTRSNYKMLVDAGVEVYEYTPGFIHAKQMTVDEDYAIIGTINFDYRSFYLHQENAVWMYRTTAIAEMIADFEDTLAKSRRVSLADVHATPWYRRGLWILLRTFAPIM